MLVADGQFALFEMFVFGFSYVIALVIMNEVPHEI